MYDALNVHMEESTMLVPSGSICMMLPSMSTWRKAPGMSAATTYHPSFASIAHDSIIA